MEHHYLNIDGTKLFYAEKNMEADRTIFFFHGNSSSHHTWQKQFSSPLLDDYQLIAFDLPAHGLSDAALEVTEGYSLPAIANLMAKATFRLANGKPYLLTGFSLGTNIVSEMLQYEMQPSGIVLISSCAISIIDDLQKVFLPNSNAGIYFQEEINVEALKGLARDAFFVHDAANLARFMNDFITTKTPFRSMILKTALEGKFSNEIALLQKSGLALLIVFGSNEKNVNPDNLNDISLSVWRHSVLKLQNACHFVHLDQSDVLNQLLADYAADCFKPAHS